VGAIEPEKLKKEKEALIEKLIIMGVLRSPEVIRAMRKVPRELFVPEDMKKHSYVDSPLYIGYGQTISAPHS